MRAQPHNSYHTNIWELCNKAQLPKLFAQRRDLHIQRACKKDRFTIPSLEEHWIVSCVSMPAQFIQVRTCCSTEPCEQQCVLFSHEKHSELLISFLSLFSLHLQLWTFLLNIPHKQEQMYKWERILFLSEKSGSISTKKILWNCEGPIRRPQGSDQALFLLWFTLIEYLASGVSTIWLQNVLTRVSLYGSKLETVFGTNYSCFSEELWATFHTKC